LFLPLGCHCKGPLYSAIVELGNVAWELKDGKIVRSFQFPSFIRAIEIKNEIAKVAEI